MDYLEWAHKIINDHKNPVVKFQTGKGKLFLPEYNEEESKLLEERLDTLKSSLVTERADIRSGRCKGEWITAQNIIKLTRLVGSKFHNMGFQNSSGKFVYPEEGLFLIETNRAEVLYNSIPLSIEQAYLKFLTENTNLNKYRAYRKLVLRGYDVIRQEISEKKSLKSEMPSKKKTKLDLKTKTILPLHCKTVGKTKAKLNNDLGFRNVLQNLRERGPKPNIVQIDKVCDYKINVSGSTNLKFEFDLHLMNDEDLDPKIGFYKENTINVYCNVNNDSVIFNRFSSVNLPTLD